MLIGIHAAAAGVFAVTTPLLKYKIQEPADPSRSCDEAMEVFAESTNTVTLVDS